MNMLFRAKLIGFSEINQNLFWVVICEMFPFFDRNDLEMISCIFLFVLVRLLQIGCIDRINQALIRQGRF